MVGRTRCDVGRENPSTSPAITPLCRNRSNCNQLRLPRKSRRKEDMLTRRVLRCTTRWAHAQLWGEAGNGCYATRRPQSEAFSLRCRPSPGGFCRCNETGGLPSTPLRVGQSPPEAKTWPMMWPQDQACHPREEYRHLWYNTF